jgi:hypothetical protein
MDRGEIWCQSCQIPQPRSLVLDGQSLSSRGTLLTVVEFEQSSLLFLLRIFALQKRQAMLWFPHLTPAFLKIPSQMYHKLSQWTEHFLQKDVAVCRRT